MMGFRVFAAVLGCLAVLAAGLTTVAAATSAENVSVAVDSAMGEAPCRHCDECEGAPCPAPSATCIQVCMSVTPSLAVTSGSLPMPGAIGKAFRRARPAGLIGLSPPPDPFPPRA
jgi:hypothetical protein